MPGASGAACAAVARRGRGEPPGTDARPRRSARSPPGSAGRRRATGRRARTGEVHPDREGPEGSRRLAHGLDVTTTRGELPRRAQTPTRALTLPLGRRESEDASAREQEPGQEFAVLRQPLAGRGVSQRQPPEREAPEAEGMKLGYWQAREITLGLREPPRVES